MNSRQKLLRRHFGERGQASLEFAVMLIGFGMILLGMIFLCAVSYDDNGILLDAKYRAESAANTASSGASFASGSEIRDWTYTKLDLFSNGSTIVIPFTPADRTTSSGDNSIAGAGNAFDDDSVSAPTPRKAMVNGREREFTYDYKWLSPKGFSSDLAGDYNDELNSGENAMDAAQLVRGESIGNTYKTMADIFNNSPRSSGNYSQGQTYDWFGLRIRETDLSKSPVNQVYMPRNR